MKKYLSTLCLLISTIVIGQINIPDNNFKNYLLGNAAINTDTNTTEISLAEAQAFTGIIDCKELSISDLTGIEHFTAVTQLICSKNSLTTLNVSANTALTKLDCSENQLTALDVSANTSLTNLKFSSNSISAINLSQNTQLTNFDCYNNKITELDISQNTAIQLLNCAANDLTSLILVQNTALKYAYIYSMSTLTKLDVANGNNANIAYFYSAGTPNLSCIKIDDEFTPDPTKWTKDNASTYNTDCSLGVENNTFNNQYISLFPNPASELLTVKTTHQIKTIEVYNLLGKKVIQQSPSNKINISNLNSGMYLVKVSMENQRVAIKRFVKK